MIMSPAHSTDAPEQAQTTEVWSPFDLPQPRTFPLKSSGGRATVTFSAWTALERMAYEDATTTTLMTKDSDGSRTVRLGRMNALLVTSTIRGWTGFPDQVTRATTEAEQQRAADGGRVVADVITEATDLRRLEHLQMLGPDVYAELVDLAGQVQPLPGQEAAAAKRAADAARDQNGTQAGTDDEDGPDVEDPSRTPSTPPVDEDAGQETPSRSRGSRSASSTPPRRTRAASTAKD